MTIHIKASAERLRMISFSIFDQQQHVLPDHRYVDEKQQGGSGRDQRPQGTPLQRRKHQLLHPRHTGPQRLLPLWNALPRQVLSRGNGE